MTRCALSSLVGVAIFVALPLLGWGAKGAREFFADPARLLYAVLAVLASVSVAIVAPHEEKLLASEFGAEWETYARRSWRLVPWVY